MSNLIIPGYYYSCGIEYVPRIIKTYNYEVKSTHCVSYVHHVAVIKAVPLQAWSGPEVSRKLRFPDFVTTAQDGGKVVSLTHRPPLPQEMLLVVISVRG